MFRSTLPFVFAFLVIVTTTGVVSAEEPSTVPADVLSQPDGGFWERRAPESFHIRFTTSEGDFVMEVQRSWAPIGADRLFNLVRAGFFDDSRFYRVRAGFIAQFGIPGDPVVAQVWEKRSVMDDPVRETNVRGTFAFAMTGPDTRTTQIYINLVDNSRLDAEGFAPLGKVVEGMDVVDRLYAGYDESAGGGMRGGKQGEIFVGGNAHLDEAFPKLTRLVRAVIDSKGDQ